MEFRWFEPAGHFQRWEMVAAVCDGLLAKIELRPANGWTLLRSLVEMLGGA
jgi:hypothetical protein